MQSNSLVLGDGMILSRTHMVLQGMETWHGINHGVMAWRNWTGRDVLLSSDCRPGLNEEARQRAQWVKEVRFATNKSRTLPFPSLA